MVYDRAKFLSISLCLHGGAITRIIDFVSSLVQRVLKGAINSRCNEKDLLYTRLFILTSNGLSQVWGGCIEVSFYFTDKCWR